MIEQIDTGYPIVDFFLFLLVAILFTYPILGGFAWFIGVLCHT